MIATIRTALALIVVGLVTIVLMPVQVLALRTGWPDPAWAPGFFHRVTARAVGLRIRVVGAPDRRRPLMLASNHVSWADIVVLSTLAKVSFVAKSEMAGWPVIGTLARLQRSIFIEREKKGKAGEQAGEIAARMARGDVIVLFPEGTTADGNFLLPFKTTLFGAAQLARGPAQTDGRMATVFVQPVSIAYVRVNGIPMGRRHRGLVSWIGDTDLVPHLLGVLREGAVDVEVRFGEAVAFDEGTDRKQVARLVEAQVRTLTAQSLRGR